MLAIAHAGGMYEVISAEAPASDAIWWVFMALQRLDEAADVIASAEVQSSHLAEETTWRNDGVSPRALREALDELHTTITHVLAEVRDARVRVETAIRS